MPYEFNWHDPEHSIIRVDIVGQVTWEGYSSLTDHVCDELAKANHRVDVIFNDKVGMPKGNPMPHLKSSSSRMAAYASLGLIVSVSTRSVSSFTKLMIDIMMRAYQVDNSHNGGFVTTVEEAMTIINKSREQDKVAETAK